VANQLKHYGKIRYFNKRNTAEIDFILNEEIALEVKQKAIEPDLRKLGKLAANLDIKNYYIVSNTHVKMDNVVYPWFF